MITIKIYYIGGNFTTHKISKSDYSDLYKQLNYHPKIMAIDDSIVNFNNVLHCEVLK